MTSKEKPEDATPEIAGTHADMASRSTNSPLDASALRDGVADTDSRVRSRLDPDPRGTRSRPQAPRHVHRRHVRRHRPAPHGVRGVDNAIDEALAGHCDDIMVVIHTDNSISSSTTAAAFRPTSRDDDDLKRSAAEIVMTELHAGGKFDQNSLQGLGRAARRGRLGGERAVGMAGAAHLARRQGALPGVPPRRAGEALEVTGETDKRGTEVHFLAATEIFGHIEFHSEILAKRLREPPSSTTAARSS